MTRSRSGHIPVVSTPDVEVAPETKKTRPWRPYTKRTEPNRKTLEHYCLKQAEVKALDSGPFTETASSKRLRHQNEEEARPRICLSPSRIVKNRGARAPITRRLRSHHVKSEENQTKRSPRRKPHNAFSSQIRKSRWGSPSVATEPKRGGEVETPQGQMRNGSDALQIRRYLRVEPDPDSTTTKTQIYNKNGASSRQTTNR